MFQIIDGAHLKGEDVTNMLDELKSLEAYQELVDTLAEASGASMENMKLQKTYQFNGVSNEKAVGNFYGKTLTVTDEDEKVLIDYSDVQYENNESDDVVFLSGSMLAEVDGKKIQRIFNTVDGGIEVVEKERNPEFELKDAYHEDLPDNPNFKLGDYSSDDVEANSWYEFCAPGGYQHCGAGCGYNLEDGGGPPINSTDLCCVGHDQCWAAHGSWDPCCDKSFLDCLSGIYTATAIAARAAFTVNSLRC
ncbi:hypothetical protein [Alkalibacillus silvisoli]|uniref:Phospholipase A2 domain-containing protein n=1 Tax=Alkalibacillus silvisoli TaxID=392823 RepID=A0ABN1A066_9BACI